MKLGQSVILFRFKRVLTVKKDNSNSFLSNETPFSNNKRTLVHKQDDMKILNLNLELSGKIYGGLKFLKLVHYGGFMKKIN